MNTYLNLAKVKNGWTYTSLPQRQALGPFYVTAAEKKRGMALYCAIEGTHWQIALI